MSQADLIRNYFFMRMHADQQDNLYKTLWAPLQERLGDDLTECIRHFLMKDGAVVKQGEVFFTLKDRADKKLQKGVILYLKELVKFAGYYERLLHPAREPSTAMRRRLERLKRIEVTTAYPFLLNVYHDYAEGHIAESQAASILDVLENYVLRRFVCGVPTNTLNKIFPPLYSQAKQHGELVEGVKAVLSSKNYPRDDEFRERFATARFYGGDRGTKGRLILERLEESFGHLESVTLNNSITIEHVMPQTLTEWWRDHLGENWEIIHERWLDSIGNLTLSGYNPHLSNADYPTKRSMLRNSHFELNQFFNHADKWDEDIIRSRAEQLALRAASLWNYFGSSQDIPDEPSTGEAEADAAGFELSTVLTILGGVKSQSGTARLPLYILNDGRIVAVKYSKLYKRQNYYWYGLRPNIFEEMRSAGASHIVFVMGQFGLATIPLDTLESYCSQTRVSYHSDGSIRHYHVLITHEENPVLNWSSTTPQYQLEGHFRKFE